MKVTILEKKPGQEDELIICCDRIDDQLMKLINTFKQGSTGKLSVYDEDRIVLIEPKNIYYFESVDTRVFAYGKDRVYESRQRLYELEEELSGSDFFRATKSTIINLEKIRSLSPSLGGRFEAILTNGEKLVISRQYVSALKEKLGL